MKIVGMVARILLGLVFLVFGLNGFLHFIPMPPMPPSLASQYLGALIQSHYTVVVSLLEVVGAVLLLVNRYVPLGLTILGPVVVNILLFHLLMAKSGLPLAIVIVVLWLIVFSRVYSAFSGLFQQRVPD